jgi:ribonuclease-3
VALQLDLGQYLVLGKGEELSGGRSKHGLLADAVEAVLAAMYLDAGLDVCRRFVEEHVIGGTDLKGVEHAPETVDAKSALQEYALARCITPPRYAVLREEGPQHSKRFTVEVRLASGWAAEGEGASKKAASQQAARHLLTRLLGHDAGNGG